SAAEQTVVNDRPLQRHAELRGGIDSPAPHAAAEEVEVFRVLAHQQGLGLAVADLLLQVGADGRASIVPDEARRAETDPAAPLLQPPAHVHVVARLLE